MAGRALTERDTEQTIGIEFGPAWVARKELRPVAVGNRQQPNQICLFDGQKRTGFIPQISIWRVRWRVHALTLGWLGGRSLLGFFCKHLLEHDKRIPRRGETGIDRHLKQRFEDFLDLRAVADRHLKV